jgi:hypothetical protein
LAGLAGIILAVGCLGYFAWQNAGSRNLGLATATLAAAMILFSVQLRFELRAKDSMDFITAEFTVNREKPEIRQWNYGSSPTARMGRELSASQKFAVAHPGQFNGDREKLTRDMVIFSLLSYLGTEQFDWQMKRTQFVGQSIGTFTTTVMENPFCKISVTLEGSGMVSFVKPQTGGLEQPILANAEPKLETRTIGIRVAVHYLAITSQHRDMPKYQEWSKRLVKGAETWFMGSS